MIKKRKINNEKLTDNIVYHIEDNTIYLLLNSNIISKSELNVASKKITILIEDNDLSYINISGKHLEDKKKTFIDFGFTMSYYDVNKLNALYEGESDKMAYRCYGIMTKKDFYNKLNEDINTNEKSENRVENILETKETNYDVSERTKKIESHYAKEVALTIENSQTEKNPKIKKENQTVLASNSGYISNLLLLFGGIILLCYFCVEGAIYLVK